MTTLESVGSPATDQQLGPETPFTGDNTGNIIATVGGLAKGKAVAGLLAVAGVFGGLTSADMAFDPEPATAHHSVHTVTFNRDSETEPFVKCAMTQGSSPHEDIVETLSARYAQANTSNSVVSDTSTLARSLDQTPAYHHNGWSAESISCLEMEARTGSSNAAPEHQSSETRQLEGDDSITSSYDSATGVMRFAITVDGKPYTCETIRSSNTGSQDELEVPARLNRHLGNVTGHSDSRLNSIMRKMRYFYIDNRTGTHAPSDASCEAGVVEVFTEDERAEIVREDGSDRIWKLVSLAGEKLPYTGSGIVNEATGVINPPAEPNPQRTPVNPPTTAPQAPISPSSGSEMLFLPMDDPRCTDLDGGGVGVTEFGQVVALCV